MFTTKTIALTAGLSLAMFGFAAPASAGQHQHQNQHHHHHHGNYNEGYGFGFEIPDVYIDLGHPQDSHVSWCYRHRPNYDEDTDMYFAHGYWQPCIAPFD